MKFVIIIIPLLFILFYIDFVSYIMAQEPKISKDYLNYSFEPFLSINGPYYLDILNEKKENLTLGEL